MVWSQLNPDKTHIAFACLGFFTFFFALCSCFIKEKIFFGEAPLSTIYGLIIGPHCLNWFNPYNWNNFLSNTLEISRVLLCIELVAVGIELPPKYIYKHFLAIFYLLSFAMIVGWLVFAAFVYLLIPGYSFAWGLLISACVTATDPVLAQAIIGKSKFAADRVPNHIKRLLTAESALNDGLAVPFVYLALNIIIHAGHPNEIAKDFIITTILYECIFGSFFGFLFGYLASWLVRLSKKYNLIDKESNIFFSLTMSFFLTGISPILGIDDLLASFFAGCAFVWDDWLDRSNEEESFIDSLDVFLNITYFVYFGSIIPWDQFNNSDLGLNCWRLIILAIVFLILRRFPAVIMHYKINPDIHSLKEAIFVGHFGPIGVSGLFACILAISDLEATALHIKHGPVVGDVGKNVEFSQLINTVYPLVSYLVVVSLVVHGSSAAFIVFSSFLKRKLSFSFNKNDKDNVNNNEKSVKNLKKVQDDEIIEEFKNINDENNSSDPELFIKVI
jgi:CPA1 family monovalent cation:H+ antiporter